MTAQPGRKISRTLIALGSTALLFAAAALGFYNSSVTLETLLDRNMLHQCNGPQRGVKLTVGTSRFMAALPPATVRLFYIPTAAANINKFCKCDLVCATGNADLYMTDYEGYWVYPQFLNNWQPEEEYDCISTVPGNEKDSCGIRGVGDDWYAYIMIRARTPATGCTIECNYVNSLS